MREIRQREVRTKNKRDLTVLQAIQAWMPATLFVYTEHKMSIRQPGMFFTDCVAHVPMLVRAQTVQTGLWFQEAAASDLCLPKSSITLDSTYGSTPAKFQDSIRIVSYPDF